MKRSLISAAFLSMAGYCLAAAPAGAPAGTTGVCKDGSYVSVPDQKGACRGHKGVKEWYAASAAAVITPPTATPGTAPAAPATPGMTASPNGTPPPTAAATRSPRTNGSFTPAAIAAPGGGPGMVWANDSSKVYHCSSDKWYGKTRHGAYMSEADAKAKGFHAEHGKACA